MTVTIKLTNGTIVAIPDVCKFNCDGDDLEIKGCNANSLGSYPLENIVEITVN